jgi:hypothetical protein
MRRTCWGVRVMNHTRSRLGRGEEVGVILEFQLMIGMCKYTIFKLVYLSHVLHVECNFELVLHLQSCFSHEDMSWRGIQATLRRPQTKVWHVVLSSCPIYR